MTQDEKLSELIEKQSIVQLDLSVVSQQLGELIGIARENAQRITRIEQWLRNPSSAARQIEGDLKRENEALVKEFRCPLCQSDMTARIGKMREYFAGCTRYPDCHGSRSMNGVDTSPKPKRRYSLAGVKTLHEVSENAPQ